MWEHGVGSIVAGEVKAGVRRQEGRKKCVVWEGQVGCTQTHTECIRVGKSKVGYIGRRQAGKGGVQGRCRRAHGMGVWEAGRKHGRCVQVK